MLKYVSPEVLIPCLTFDLSLVEVVIIGARMCPGSLDRAGVRLELVRICAKN